MRYQHIFARPWIWVLLSVLSLAAQCQASMPPLPTTPDEPTIPVALLTPNSGELATVGRTMQNGVEMAFDEVHSSGISGHRFELVIYDAGCTFASARQATQQAINDGLKFIVGPLCSEAAIAGPIAAEQANVLIFAPAAAHPLVTVNPQGQTRPTIFRGSFSYDLQGQAAARFGRETLNLSRAAIFVNPADDYSSELVQAFTRQFTTAGGRIVYQSDYSPDTADFLASIMSAGQAGAELIYLPASVTIANRVAAQLQASEWADSLTLLGSDAWDFDSLDLAAAEGSYFPVHFSPDNPQPHVQSWIETYEARYATAPNALAAVSYDSAHLLAEAIRQAGSNEPAKVAQYLEGNVFDAITGPVSFDAHHNPLKPVPFVKVEKGHTIYITSVLP